MIKFTGDLRLDFEKATAEIIKLKDRILGYQEQIVSLRTSVKRLKQSKDSAKRKYTESLAEKGIALPMQRLFLITMATIQVRPLRRHR